MSDQNANITIVDGATRIEQIEGGGEWTWLDRKMTTDDGLAHPPSAPATPCVPPPSNDIESKDAWNVIMLGDLHGEAERSLHMKRQEWDSNKHLHFPHQGRQSRLFSRRSRG